MGGPRVFMDISIGNNPPERLLIELFAGNAPKAVENFRALCTGEKGIGMKTGKPLHYRGCGFYLCNSLRIAGGDFENQNGTGGESIYGGTFSYENIPRICSERGIIMMNIYEPIGVGSKFFICLKHNQFVPGVAVGKVIKGMETVEKIEQLATPNRKPSVPIEIMDCGEISEDNVIVRKGESEAELQMDNDLKKCESSDEKPEATTEKPSRFAGKEKVIEMKQIVKEIQLLLPKLVEVNEEGSNLNKVDWLMLAASAATIFLAGAFFRGLK